MLGLEMDLAFSQFQGPACDNLTIKALHSSEF